jgi:hypothetical protein
MSVIKRAKEAQETKKRRIGPQKAQVADWASADGELLRKAIENVSRTGGALRFGYSRDGGAYAIGVLGDGDPYTLWVPGNQDINEGLQNIIVGFED